MTIRIDMNVSNYERVASRWNDVHFASRKHLASILTNDFNLESPMTQRRLKALETRARAFYANQLEKDLKAQEAYDKQRAPDHSQKPSLLQFRDSGPKPKNS